MAAKIIDKVKDVVGDNVIVEVTSLNDYINTAIAELSEVIPADILLKYHNGAATTLSNSPKTLDVAGNKVLAVLRKDSSDILRDCMQVNQIDFETKYNNSGSTYSATDLTPVWSTIKEVLHISPEPTATETASVYKFTYPSTDWGASSAVAITGIPTELEQAVIFRAGMNIIQSYLSKAVQEDEDAEMQSMLTGQAQALSTAYQQEVARYMKGGAS